MPTDILMIVETIENEMPLSWPELIHVSRLLQPDDKGQMVLVIAGKDIQASAEQVADEFGIQVDIIAREQ